MTATITDGDALLRAIIAKPDDDSPRLVYADWLEENGQVERAEFIRVQIALANAADRSLLMQAEKRIERAWINANRKAIRAELGVDIFLLRQGTTGDGNIEGLFHRGFIAEVRCTEKQWVGKACTFNHNGAMDLPFRCDNGRTYTGMDGMKWIDCPKCHGTGHLPGIGQRIAQTHPVERVVTDRQPWFDRYSGLAWWFQGSDEQYPRATIHAGIYGFLKKGELEMPDAKPFVGEQAALDAYSRAAIEWARRQTCVGGYHVATTEDACTTTSL